jgi:hypothetical protein
MEYVGPSWIDLRVISLIGNSRGGKYSGPWDHWSHAGRKKKGKEEKGGKKEKKEKERKKKEGKKKNRKKE